MLRSPKLLLFLLALCIGLGSAFQISRYPSRLRASARCEHLAEVKFSADGKTLVGIQSGTRWHAITIRLWDVETGRQRAAVPTDLRHVRLVLLSPDGRCLAALDSVAGVRIWHLPTGKQHAIPSADGARDPSHGWMGFSPDGKLLAVEVQQPPTCSLFDTETAQKVASFPAPVRNLAFTPDGQTLVWSSSSLTADRRVLHLWDVRTRRQRAEKEAHRDVIGCLALTPDGKTIATATICQERAKPEIKLWETATLEEKAAFTTETVGLVHSLFFSPDGRLLVAGEIEPMVWDVAARPPRQVARFQCQPTFVRDGTVMAAFHKAEGLELWDTATLQRRTTFRWHERSAGSSFHPMGATLAGNGALLAVVSADDGGKLGKLPRWMERVMGRPLGDAAHLTTEFWDPTTGEFRGSFGTTGIMSPDGGTFVIVGPDVVHGPDNELQLWDLPPRWPLEYRLGLWLSSLLAAAAVAWWVVGKMKKPH